MSCVLPKEWNGVYYGGLDRLVMFIDLDCRFDILRLSKMLKHRINGQSNGENLYHLPLFADKRVNPWLRDTIL